MKKITVISKTDTTHDKYGKLKVGMELEIEPKDFGDQIFEKKTVNKNTEKTETKKQGGR